jgi:molybdopterin molybdotransferase
LEAKRRPGTGDGARANACSKYFIMISVEEARKIISDNITTLKAATSTIGKASGHVLAADIYATRNIPAFPQSSMDGYAFSFADWKQGLGLPLAGEVQAGSPDKSKLVTGTAIRIFTGAPVPSGADTVVMQEKTRKENNTLFVEDVATRVGLNVRPEGSEIKAGELALPAGTKLTPAAIGFLAAIGVTELLVFPRPSISIIITGKELQVPGSALNYGEVYECNSFSLGAALHQFHFDKIIISQVDDDLDLLKEVLLTNLDRSDVVLLTGGISAGDYDFVLQAATACGVTTKFHKIKQRPGKPLYFGTKENKLVFGLPGNPSSVLTCFYEYVMLALYQLGHDRKELQSVQAPLGNNFQKVPGLTHFAKGYYDGKKVAILDAQESYRLSSFAKSNCLVVLKEDIVTYMEGEMVEIHLLP